MEGRKENGEDGGGERTDEVFLCGGEGEVALVECGCVFLI